MGASKSEPPRTPGPKTAIGIDFGSSKCCVGLVRDGKVEILENERGNKTTPSYVAFTEAERLVGESARDQVALNPTNTVFGAKQLLGRKGESRNTIVEIARHLPYDVTQENGGVKIKVVHKSKKKKLYSEQIAAMLLSQMKKLAEKHLDCPVREAVIAVPAHFTNAQRRALKDAGSIAGLTVMGLINETTAAAVAYQDGKTFAKKQNVLVVDIGSGAFNAAVVEVQDASVEVKAICGTPELSGSGLDRVLVDHMADRFTRLNTVNVRENKKAFERLKTACQKAKHTLTLLSETVVQVDCLVGDLDFSDTVKRGEFNEKCINAAQKTIEKVLNSVLSDARLTPPEIDEVVLIGGTTRVPALQEVLVKFFAGKPLNKTVNPDEAVAHGAALQAAILVGDNSVAEVRVVDIVANPVVYPNFAGKRPGWLVVPKNGEEYYLYYDWYLNKNDRFKKKLLHFIDSFGVYDPKCTPAVIEKVKTTHINVKLIQAYLTDQEVSIMTREVEQFDRDDEEYRQLICAVTELEALCFSVKGKLTSEEDGKDTVSRAAPEALGFCDETLDWLDLNELSSKNEYENRRIKLQNLFAAAKSAMIDKSKSYTKDVNEQKGLQKGKVTDEGTTNDVKIVELIENPTPPDKEQSKTFAGNECVSQQKVSTLEVPPDTEYNNINSNLTEPSEATSVSAVVESPGGDNEVKKVEVSDAATENKPTPVGMLRSGCIDELGNDIAGETFYDSTHWPNQLQYSLLNYRDPTTKIIHKNEPELKETVPSIIGVSPNVRDDATCGGQSNSSANSNVESISLALQNICLNTEVTESVENCGPYSEALEISSCFHLRDAPPPSGGTTFDDSEPMEFNAPEHCIHAGSEEMSMNVGWEENVLQKQQESGCGHNNCNGNFSQEPQLLEHVDLAVNKPLRNVPDPIQLGVTHHRAGTSDQHYSHNNDQANLCFIGQPTSSSTHWPSPPLRRLPYSDPSNQGGSSHGHSSFSQEPPQQWLSPQNITENQIRYCEFEYAQQMVVQYINYRHDVIRNLDKHNLSLPIFTCFFCFFYPYPLKIHGFLMEWYQRLAGCAITSCVEHGRLLYPPH